jgi:hypothetical protein
MWIPPTPSQLPYVGLALNWHGQPQSQLQLSSCAQFFARIGIFDIDMEEQCRRFVKKVKVS